MHQASNNTMLSEIATQLGFDPLGCTVIIVECSARIDIAGKHGSRLHGDSSLLAFLPTLSKLYTSVFQRYFHAINVSHQIESNPFCYFDTLRLTNVNANPGFLFVVKKKKIGKDIRSVNVLDLSLPRFMHSDLPSWSTGQTKYERPA